MNLLKFIPIKLTFLLVLGILIGYFFDIGIEFPILLTLVFLSVLGLLLFKEKETIGISFGIIAAFTTIVLGILIVAMAQPKNTDAHYSNILLFNYKEFNSFVFDSIITGIVGGNRKGITCPVN